VAVSLGYQNVYRDPKGFPQWQARGLPVGESPAGLTDTAKTGPDYGSLSGWAFVWTLTGIFFGGMALNLTPCVYPLIPITVSYFGGQKSSGKSALFIHGVCYVGGLALTNSALGVAAALTGGLMGALLQNPIVLGAVCVILLGFAASMFGLWELRLPYGLTQAAARSYAGYFGSLFMGITLGVVAAPCIGPFVLGLLTWVASLGNPMTAFLVFFVLSLGLGLPLFVLGMFSGQLEKLPKSGMWMLWVRRLMGWVLVGMAVYFIKPLFPATIGTAVMAVVAGAAGLHLGWIDPTRADFIAFEWMKALAGTAGLVIAAFLISSMVVTGPGARFHTYSDRLMARALSENKPVVIDFSAAWCAPCRELDDVTFHHPEIVRLSESEFIMVKVDLTQNGNPIHEKLLVQYEVKGVPTVIFINASGTERRELRLVDFLPPEQFLVRMADLKRSTSD